jgi:hypothetical protein
VATVAGGEGHRRVCILTESYRPFVGPVNHRNTGFSCASILPGLDWEYADGGHFMVVAGDGCLLRYALPQDGMNRNPSICGISREEYKSNLTEYMEIGAAMTPDELLAVVGDLRLPARSRSLGRAGDHHVDGRLDHHFEAGVVPSRDERPSHRGKLLAFPGVQIPE